MCLMGSECVCVCVFVRERERERNERMWDNYKKENEREKVK